MRFTRVLAALSVVVCATTAEAQIRGRPRPAAPRVILVPHSAEGVRPGSASATSTAPRENAATERSTASERTDKKKGKAKSQQHEHSEPGSSNEPTCSDAKSNTKLPPCPMKKRAVKP